MQQDLRALFTEGEDGFVSVSIGDVNHLPFHVGANLVRGKDGRFTCSGAPRLPLDKAPSKMVATVKGSLVSIRDEANPEVWFEFDIPAHANS
jgi:hypothetical protein